MQSNRKAFTQLLYKLKACNGKILNGSVKDLKLQEAETLNRSGLTKQLDYMVNQLGLREATKLADELIVEQTKLEQIVLVVKKRRQLSELVQLIYHHKAREAEGLMMQSYGLQIKYLMDRLGGEEMLYRVLDDLSQ